MRRVLCGFVLAVLALPAAAQEPTPIRRIALIVGTNDGGHGRVELRYAESDATTVHDVLSRLGGVSPADGRLVLSPDLPTLEAELDRMKEELANAEGSRRVEFLFYYSGHSDETGLLLGEERFGYRELRERLDALPADVRIAILDSCASGAMTRRKGGSWKPPFMVDDASQVTGHAFLTSSADDEAAQESDRLKASFFTHYLVSGLRGAADVTGDSRVTLNEAYQFAFDETLARTEATKNGAQHPAYDIQLSGTGDLVMTDLRGSDAGLRLANEVNGRVFVRDAEGRLTAELSKYAGRAVDLGLEAGDYVVTVTSDEQVYGARVRLVNGRRTDLTRLQLVSMPVEVATARGGRHVELPAPLVADDGKPQAPHPETLPFNAPGPIIDLPGVNMPGLPASARDVVTEIQTSLGDTPEDQDHERVFVHLGLVPGIGLPMNAEKTIAAISVGFVPGIEKVYGLAASLGGNVIGSDVGGASLAVGFNWIGRDASWLVASSGFNVVERDARGLLAAPGFNVVAGGDESGESMRLVSMAAGFNVTGGSMAGAQLAAGFNVAGDDLRGVQAAAGFNVLAGELRGVQGAAGFNRAGNVKGAQIAVLNIANDVTGLQLGIINVADKVKGAQIGLLNFNDDIKGAPIGLLTVSKTGMFHPHVSAGVLTPLNVGIKIGTRRVYSHASLGTAPLDWYGNFGVGARFPFSAFYVDFDLGAGFLDLDRVEQVSLPEGIQGLAFLTTARAMFGWQPLSHLGVFVGVSGHMIMPPREAVGGASIPSSLSVRPDVFAGISF